MRNILLAFAALAVVTLSSVVMADDQAATSVLQDSVQAAAVAPVAENAAVTEEAVVAKKANTHRRHYRRPQKNQNVFQRLMDLERKKNAWLMRTFFGR